MISEDMTNYFSAQDRITELELELEFLRQELRSMRANNPTTNNEIYKNLLITYKPALKDKAVLMIKKVGKTGFSLREIAQKVGLSYSRVKVLSMYVSRGEM